MLIVIPTHMREDNQKCYNSMPQFVKNMTVLAARSDRVAELTKYNPSACIIDLGETDGIADVRQRVVEYAKDEKVLIMDDSCVFMQRDSDLKLSEITEEGWKDMLNMVETMLDEYPWVGISDRGGNNRVPEDFKEVARSYSCYGINPVTMREHGVRFDGMYQKNKEIKLYEDFYATLALLTKGVKNAVIFKYAFNHPHGKPGGNSVFRTTDLQRKCLEALSTEFPGLVKLVKKEDPSWVTGEGENFRWEAIISWSEAYKGGGNSLEDFF